MDTVKKILNYFEEFSDDDAVISFLKEIFVKEEQGLHHYRDEYKSCVEKYYEDAYYEDWGDSI